MGKGGTGMKDAAVNLNTLRQTIRPTTVVEAPRLNSSVGAQITIVSETFQYTGSFKFRAAYCLASNVSHNRIITASSGNFGQALAYACSLLGKTCAIVMPETSAKVKVDAVKEYGGIVELTDVRVKSRAERLSELADEYPDAYVASPFDDELIIEGNSTLGLEICSIPRDFDYVVVPVGGGGLVSGIITAISREKNGPKVVGAEPLLANDAARSLRSGQLQRNETEPFTIADGARTLSLGKLNWEIIRQGIHQIVEVPEQDIEQAVRLLYALANLKSEPTGALSLAALLSHRKLFEGRSVCCVVSGGNVDPSVYSKIIS